MTNLAEPRDPEIPGSLSVGDVVADRYRIEAPLGEGGMGVVYRVEHLHLRKLFALKVLLPAWSSMPEVVTRFEREAVAAGSIQSPHVAAATDFGRLPDGSFFLVMEYVNGRTLRSAVEAGAIEPARALHIMQGIVSGMSAAHALGIVHRDLKPENVMLIARDGDPDFVKVLDFGIAKVDGFGGTSAPGPSQALTKVGAVIGTPDYMAPEQALGQPVDARSDLYSLGVILFEMLTGQCPFVGGAVTVLRQHVMAEPPELPASVLARMDARVRALLRRLLAKAPENRFENASDLAIALDQCAGAYRDTVPPAARPSLESVRAMVTPVAQRVRRSVLGTVQAIEVVGRRTWSDPTALLRHLTRGRVIVAGALVTFLTIVILVLTARLASRASPPVGSGSEPTVSTAAAQAPLSPSEVTEGPTSLTVLPPPPPPSASSTTSSAPSPSAAGEPASSQGHRTGRSGIYIPPPSQWFR